MSSRFNNVKVLLSTAENYNLQELVDLLLDEDTQTDDLAEDIAFVLISMWGLIPEKKKYAFIDRLTSEMVDLEIKKMFPEIKETHCVNCGWAITHEDGEWTHDDSECPCIDPEPWLSDI